MALNPAAFDFEAAAARARSKPGLLYAIGDVFTATQDLKN